MVNRYYGSRVAEIMGRRQDLVAELEKANADLEANKHDPEARKQLFFRRNRHCLRWEQINWEGGRNGVLLVAKGKTKAARRVLPMSPRVRSVLEDRWNWAAGPERVGCGLPKPKTGTSITTA